MATTTSTDTAHGRPARLPPRWFIRAFWVGHRALYTATGGRVGLRRPGPGRWGMCCLRTVGRRTGLERRAIIAYLEDGDDLVLMAMNGWAAADPAWFLNLRAHPDVTVDLPDGRRRVVARIVEGEERARLWARWQAVDRGLDEYAARRASTPLIVLSPAPVAPPVAGPAR